MNRILPLAIPTEAYDSAAPISEESMALTNGDDALLVIPVSIDGIGTHAVLDCGATRSLVDAGFAARHGIRSSEARRVVGFNGSALAGLARPLDIFAGSVHLRNIEPLIFDLENLARAARTSFEALLGREFFLQAVVMIDPDAQQLRLGHEHEFDGEILSVFQSADRHFYIGIELGEGLRTDAVIDLGCTVPMYVSPRFAQQHGLFAGFKRGSTAAIGVEGVAVSQLGRMPLIRLGNLELTDIPFAVPPQWNFETPIVLGLPVFRRFRSLLDFGRGRLQLQSGRTIDRQFERDRSGLSVIPSDQGLRVVHVAANSPAARAGLIPGDLIIGIDDGRGAAPPNDTHRGLGKRASGTRYLLQIEGKGPHELILADYY